MRQREKKRLTGSFAAKAAAFILLAAGTAAGLFCGVICYFMVDASFFTSNRQHALGAALYSQAMQAKNTLSYYIQSGQLEQAALYFENRNVEAELALYNEAGYDEILWSSCDGAIDTDNTNYTRQASLMSFSRLEKAYVFGSHTLNTEDTYRCYIYIDLDFPLEDDLKELGERVLFLYEAKEFFVAGTLGCLFLCLICFLFLMCGAGHQNGREGIQPGVLERIPFDLLLLIFAFGAAVGWARYEEFYHHLSLMILGGTLFVLWVTLWCVDFAVRVKLGSVWRQTLIFMVLRGCWRVVKWVVTSLPTVFVTAGIFLGVCILELLGGCWLTRSSDWLFPWFLEKVLLFLLVIYVARTCKKLLEASRALAEGQEDYRVDVGRMFGDFRKHGEYLNSLGLGISRAVEERLKSERLKTELITNVSHDLKTPLTSIINYADLICEEDTENTKIREYAEVLLRQSRRLKKLLEDLIEAAKATTGNLEVNPEICEVGVLLSQAVGEYQQKMEEKKLELIARQPEKPIKIMADGRHLWRVFDNLLNNICKYSQECSRVYLSVEAREDRALIIFRNMSKYPLDIPPQELEERFVRGDKARHMEGNGLGLSIAKSLVELQNGNMEIKTDGDLFKVTLSFRLTENPPGPVL